MFLKNNNFSLIAVALLLFLALGLTACGSSNQPQSASADDKVAEETTEEMAPTEQAVEAPATAEPTQEKTETADCNVPAPSEPTTIDVIGWAFPITEYYEKEFDECNQVDNLTVNVQLLDNASAIEQVRLALSGGGTSPYGVVHAANSQIIEWGPQEWLMPLNDLVEKYRDEYDLDDIPQAAWDGATIDGKIYGIPVVGNTLHLMYRPDLFEKYNLEVPQTYDEVISACEVLKDEPSIDLPFTMNVHAGWAWEIEYLHFIRSFGGDYLNADNTPAFNGPEGVAGLEKMKEVVDACMGPDGLTYSINDSNIGMANGSLAFVQLWASEAVSMDDPEQSEFVGQIEFAPAAAPNPDGPLGGSAWNDYYAIPATTDIDPDLIFRVIMEVADLESQMEAAEFGMVTRSAVAESGAGGRYLPAANETIVKGVGIYPPNQAVALARTALGNWLPLVGTGELTAQEALDKAAEEYTKEAETQGFLK